MNYKSDPTFYNYVALFRAIVYKENQKEALQMTGVLRKKIEPSRQRKVKRTNVRTGRVKIFKTVEEAAVKSGLKNGSSIRGYIHRMKPIKGYKWEFVED
jgi:citrate lyase alpha subunit